ncbi:nucleoside diphosphate kinase regulator [Chitiniphilus purpureus]|uniref:Nucleoside diphosphate kinase regulator n=1 Tax=Chitiniphilus purpureus TaxID=2981137 RepID=A0ABY6DHI9_9NEIS|nr:nucleoside diphosphate kinase regulator [Chitiniphilus sp. CD1]UXY13786.1 nucleoside diphosphate kinase regulator [Chitiniphilus sp. CD1]
MDTKIILSQSDLERLEALIERQSAGTAGLAALEAELSRAEIVDDDALPADVVAMGSRARFLDEATGQEYAYTLVYPHQADIAAGRISVLAPAGSALLGLSVGQSIAWPAPGGHAMQLKVLAVTHG